MKLISSIKDSYLRRELIFAIDILLSLVASIIAIFGVRGLVGASFYFPRFLVVYLSVAIIGSVILFLWTKSFHERIRIAKVREYEYSEVEKSVDDLATLARKVEIPEMVKLMKRVVPEFMSENSRYKEFDKKEKVGETL